MRIMLLLLFLATLYLLVTLHAPRSKFFHLETIWFREEIARRGINLVKVDTKEQLGDIFTKGLTQVTLFEYLRKKLLGW
ncbi:hypothetical protein ACHAXR_010266 [Thalassiosira sp. AJA248-18]